jgi:type VII secretion integral membrane protein EccD
VAIGGSGLVRVTVTSATRRVDLVLPGAVPVANLVPALARSVGLLDPASAYAGYRLVVQDGRTLVADAGLAAQGVDDGDVITVAAGQGDLPPPAYDDAVEAMVDIVEHDLHPWDPEAGRRTALWSAVLLLLVGLLGLVLQRGSERGADVALVVAAVLLLGALALSRVHGETCAAVAVAFVGCAYAAVAGLSLGAGPPGSGTSVAAAGGGVLIAGLVAVLGLDRGRVLVLPPVVSGTALLAIGLVTQTWSVDAAVVITAALSLAVVAGTAAPWLALAATGATSGRHVRIADPFADPVADLEEIDLRRLREDALLGHEILVALSATVGLLLVLATPFAVSLGPAGTLVAGLGCVVVTLRTRHHRDGAEVLVGLASGALGSTSTALSVLWLHPSWRPGATVALVVTGVVLGASARWHATSAGRRRLADVAETVALLALPPTLVAATGVLGSIPG